ncbi:MAG: type 1 glutamine amidotransferase [Defluviicoccus sp.]|nr:type 1 glutamine amidotransferase [Defluviicoccus sp.]MDE0383381.1 type 1 glutamine amidotransferase [Defluviicoccus sp.]
MRVLVLQHIACEHLGIFRDFMAEDGIEWRAVELDEGEPIPELDGYDVLVSMGGPMDVWQKDEHPWIESELAAIREWVEQSRRPFLGFCLGHQLLAEALGGEVGPAAQPEIGVMPVRLTDAGCASPFLKGIPDKFRCLQWHSAEVIRPPPGAEVLISSPACAVNAMSWAGCAFSIQFHVELTPSTVSEWGEIPEYAGALEAALGTGALARLDAAAAADMPSFAALSRILYRNFMDAVRSNRTSS